MEKKLFEYHKFLLKTSFLGKIYRYFFLFPFLRILTGPKFIDVGCGVGSFLKYGSKESVGLDINPFNINYINNKLNLNSKLIPSSGIFPLSESSYPVIICDQVIEHLDNPNNLLNEINRVIKPNGTIIIGLPMEKGYDLDDDHKKFYKLNDILKIILNRFPMEYKSHFYFPFLFRKAGKYFRIQHMYVLFRSIK